MATPAAPPLVFTRAEQIGLNLGYAVGGVSVALICLANGMQEWVVVLAAALMYSATSQLAVVALLAGGASTVSALLTGYLVSLRFGILAVALAPRLDRPVARRVLAAHLAVDPTVAVALREKDDANTRTAYWRIATSMWWAWMAGIAVGLVAHRWLDDPKQLGLDVVIPTTLLGVLGRSFTHAAAVVTGAVAALITFVAVPRTAVGLPVLLALAAVAPGLASPRFRRGPAAGGAPGSGPS